MSNYVEVHKVELMEGEEMLQLGSKVMAALAQQKGKLKKSLCLIGIYNDHVVARDRESGKLFKMTMSRDKSGAVKLSDMVEVKQTFAAVKTEKSEEGADQPTYVDLKKASSLWEGIL